MSCFSRPARLLLLFASLWMAMCSDASGQSGNFDDLELVGTGGEILRRWTDFIAPGDLNSYPRLLGEVDEKFLFAANEDGGLRDPTLWAVDGDIVTPVPTEDTLSGLLSLPGGAYTRREPVVYQETAYFVAGTSSGSRQVWQYDGSVARPAEAFGGETFGDAIVFNGELLLIGLGGLQRFDGFGVTDIPQPPGVTSRQFVGIYEDRVLLAAQDAARGDELWQFDGQELSFVAEISPGTGGTAIVGAVEFQGDFFFHAWPHDLGMHQMYRLRGNDVTSVSPSGLINEWNPEIVVYDGSLYITGQDASTPEQAPGLWRYDGTEFELAWMPGESRYNFVSNLFVYNERLYSITHTPQFGEELWVWDGTTARMVVDLNPGPAGINGGDPFPTQFMEYNGSMFIRLTSAPGRSELWSITIPEPPSVILLTTAASIAVTVCLRR